MNTNLEDMRYLESRAHIKGSLSIIQQVLVSGFITRMYQLRISTTRRNLQPPGSQHDGIARTRTPVRLMIVTANNQYSTSSLDSCKLKIAVLRVILGDETLASTHDISWIEIRLIHGAHPAERPNGSGELDPRM